MSDTGSSNVLLSDNDDLEMQRAYEQARATFRYFWREIAWERRRIVPALDLACIKAPFVDSTPHQRDQDTSAAEQMWLNEVDFDGRVVSGVLINSPNWLKSVKAGDPARFPLTQITDWLYAQKCVVCGAFTVNLLRSRMSPRERKDHDRAWGLQFGDPTTIRVVPDVMLSDRPQTSAELKKSGADQEHPMSESMAPSLKSSLADDPSLLRAKDNRGWTLLHHQALAGSLATVKVLVGAGADVNAVTRNGMTPLQLARSLGWDAVAAFLVSQGAR